MPDRRYLVVSDLHLAGGKNPRTGRWSPTEDFFWDEDFRDFLADQSAAMPTTLILNGDLFDVLQVLVFPTEDEKKAFGIHDAEIDRRYGLQCSEGCCEFLVEQILAGHPAFFKAIAAFLAGGNEVVILKGNHDVELHWPRVQQRVKSHLGRLVADQGGTPQPDAVRFYPWFFYVPSLLYVEHGNQFEATTAFHNFVVPLLPPLKRSTPSPQLELDLSSLLVRYITNRTEPVNPLADNIRPLSRYYQVLWKQHPYFVVTTFGTAVRFVLKAFAKARELNTVRKRGGNETGTQTNKVEIRHQAEHFAGPDPEHIRRLEATLLQFETRRPTPTLARGAWKFLFAMAGGGLRRLAWLLPLYALTFLPGVAQWAHTQILATQVGWLATIGNFLFQSNLLHAVVLFLAAAILLLIMTLTQRRRRGRAEDSAAFPDVSGAMREEARHIAQNLNVKYVTFGHTHYPDTCELENGGRYFNTGTWMGIFEAQEQLNRDPRQFTFLSVSRSNASLLRWNADKRAADPVVIIETQKPLTDREDSLLTLLLKAIRG